MFFKYVIGYTSFSSEYQISFYNSRLGNTYVYDWKNKFVFCKEGLTLEVDAFWTTCLGFSCRFICHLKIGNIGINDFDEQLLIF